MAFLFLKVTDKMMKKKMNISGDEVKISRYSVKVGDHIYSWRTAKVYGKAYAHHGIYVGDGIVIHYTNHGRNNHCSSCGDQSKQCGVISSCLNCFLVGGSLYLFEYSVSPNSYLARPAGTCTTAPTDPPDVVIYRARYLKEKNGFGGYHLIENNCEDFAIYCKTSLLSGKNYLLGRSGQANSASAAHVLGVLNGSPLASDVIRLSRDIGVRKDVTKVSVESLVARGK